MSWNYRIVKKKISAEEDTYDVCEMYYDKQGNPNGYSLNHNILTADSYEGLEWVYKEVLKAYQKPVIEDVGGQLVELSE